jgi:diguanylate cyclase
MDREILATVSVGIAELTETHRSPSDVLRSADAALYASKHAGRARITVFTPEDSRAAIRAAELRDAIQHATPRGELRVEFQPEVDLVTREVLGVEALARWDHPVLGRLLPDAFLPAAEEVGAIIDVDLWVLERACRTIAGLSGRSWVPLTLSVNVSARSLLDEHLAARVGEILADTSFPGSSLCIEITESSLLLPSDPVIERLEALRRHGCFLAVDDLGTGHSSLRRLTDLPVEIVKLDRSFVEGLGHDAAGTAIVSALIGIARSLGLHTVAEGVETEHQRERLVELGCHVGQGLLFAPPLAEDDLASALAGLGRRRLPRRSTRSIRRLRGRATFIDEFIYQIGIPEERS